MRSFAWIGHVTSCIAGKRSAKGDHVYPGQRRLSNCDDGREQSGEQNGSASMSSPETGRRARAQVRRTGTSAADGQPAGLAAPACRESCTPAQAAEARS
jgi:hypothetical protein